MKRIADSWNLRQIGPFQRQVLLCFTRNSFSSSCPALDGKYHVLPSGDLHIFRVEESDASVAYSCRVLNTLTNIEESSPPFHLAVDSKSQGTFKKVGK